MSLTLKRRIEVEQIIARATIEAVLAAGFTLHDVEDERVHSIDEALALIGDLYEARVYFNKPGETGHGLACSWLYFVNCNDGWDVLSDYTIDLEKAVKTTEALVDTFENEANVTN